MAGKKGRSGRAIIPDDVKEALGYRRDRMNADRPALLQGAFIREPLTGKAAEFFEAYFPQLYKGGVLSDSDSPGFHLLCKIYAQFQEAESMLAESGQIAFTAKGERQHPAIKNYLQLSAVYLSLLREFGLTPASRSGVIAGKPALDVTPVKKLGGKPSAGKGYAGKDLD